MIKNIFDSDIYQFSISRNLVLKEKVGERKVFFFEGNFLKKEISENRKITSKTILSKIAILKFKNNFNDNFFITFCRENHKKYT